MMYTLISMHTSLFFLGLLIGSSPCTDSFQPRTGTRSPPSLVPGDLRKPTLLRSLTVTLPGGDPKDVKVRIDSNAGEWKSLSQIGLLQSNLQNSTAFMVNKKGVVQRTTPVTQNSIITFWSTTTAITNMAALAQLQGAVSGASMVLAARKDANTGDENKELPTVYRNKSFIHTPEEGMALLSSLLPTSVDMAAYMKQTDSKGVYAGDEDTLKSYEGKAFIHTPEEGAALLSSLSRVSELGDYSSTDDAGSAMGVSYEGKSYIHLSMEDAAIPLIPLHVDLMAYLARVDPDDPSSEPYYFIDQSIVTKKIVEEMSKGPTASKAESVPSSDVDSKEEMPKGPTASKAESVPSSDVDSKEADKPFVLNQEVSSDESQPYYAQ